MVDYIHIDGKLVKVLTRWILPLGYRVYIASDGDRPGGDGRGTGIIRSIAWLLSIITWIVLQVAQWTFISLCIAMLLGWFVLPSAEGAQSTQASIPAAAQKYRAALISSARAEFGLDAPVALLAAQVHQESRWRADAVSPVGAQGLAQFMPATASWLPTVAPQTGKPAPYNPGWALRALCAYDRHLLASIRDAAGEADAWAFVLAAYNGGLTWVRRDRAAAEKQGQDPARYWDSVELVNSGRRAAAFRENRGYARNIFATQKTYTAAGWGQGVAHE